MDDQKTDDQQPLPTKPLDMTLSLEALQTNEQRLVLDTIAQVRKCGLESILSLPQLVVCGDQSAGKSSVLEAVTEIPFPRNDNLCTRFATEIILRRAPVDSLLIKVIPDNDRSAEEQERIKGFREHIMDFEELPAVMDKAMVAMGIAHSASSNGTRAFAKDVLSIEIEGPSRPQLILVDIPGLIQNETKGVTEADIELVNSITQHYISQPRTICLAVISAVHDYANQGILQKVRKVDPEGERTLGIITKPDRLEHGSPSEKAFLELARNKDIFLKLGWHVLKNRKFEESNFSFQERNASEAAFFQKSIFKELPRDSTGIGALRIRLSLLLFEHIKQELPNLRNDLEQAFAETSGQLSIMGARRTTARECREFLTKFSLDYYEICKAAVDGNYQGDYFRASTDFKFLPTSPLARRRLRAMVQHLNAQFSKNIGKQGHLYYIDLDDDSPGLSENTDVPIPSSGRLTRPEAFRWVREALVRSRGRELQGNFNPLLIGELFWEQSSQWRTLAEAHIAHVSEVCAQFLDTLLSDKCTKDIKSRVQTSLIQDVLKNRNAAAYKELGLIMEDINSYPINYNRYYTEAIKMRHREKERDRLQDSINKATTHTHLPNCTSDHTSASVDVAQALHNFHMQNDDQDMEQYSSEFILDCVLAIYKVCQPAYSPYYYPPEKANSPAPRSP
jgi:GTPase SAR1 family protein